MRRYIEAADSVRRKFPNLNGVNRVEAGEDWPRGVCRKQAQVCLRASKSPPIMLRLAWWRIVEGSCSQRIGPGSIPSTKCMGNCMLLAFARGVCQGHGHKSRFMGKRRSSSFGKRQDLFARKRLALPLQRERGPNSPYKMFGEQRSADNVRGMSLREIWAQIGN